MTCPCCGQRCAADLSDCACGARRIGEPLAGPEVKLPSLGASFLALGCALLVPAAFLLIWLFGNDMKVVRALLVWAFGDGAKFTRDLLQADPNLPYYRIFSYDAYRLAFYLSAGLIPLSLVGFGLARRALRLAKSEPARFGGQPYARASLVLSAVLCLAFSAATVSLIPNAIERGRERRAAATRAMMYQLNQQWLEKFHREKGTYPAELEPHELTRMSDRPLPLLDYWERPFSYSPGSVIASKGSPVGFSNYRLVSAGPDGQFGTEDDITMIDGVVVTTPSEADLPAGLLAPEKPRQ
jgi:hypothetical protein